ncbi:MAG: hypothetical protein LBB72_01930 [Spirochaetaceae bacterium]|jgi:hypothetical protein|nr:hypothetical protein [Spirochaetaceae bacterium]
MKKIALILLIAGLLTAPALFAQDFEEVFPVFLSGLVRRNENLKTLAMPDVETLTVPEMEGQALYLINFITPEDAEIFLRALEKENIPYGIFPDDALRLVLFYEDMIVFIFKTIIGL